MSKTVKNGLPRNERHFVKSRTSSRFEVQLPVSVSGMNERYLRDPSSARSSRQRASNVSCVHGCCSGTADL